MQLAYRFFCLFQEQVHVTVGKIRRQEIEQLVIGAANKIFQVTLALNQAFAAALDLRFDPEVVAGSALGIEIPDKRGRAFACSQPGEIHGGGCFTDAPLDVVCGDDFQTWGSPANGWLRTVS